MDATVTPGSLRHVQQFFGMAAAEFRKEWVELTESDKAQIQEGLKNGSLTY